MKTWDSQKLIKINLKIKIMYTNICTYVGKNH